MNVKKQAKREARQDFRQAKKEIRQTVPKGQRQAYRKEARQDFRQAKKDIRQGTTLKQVPTTQATNIKLGHAVQNPTYTPVQRNKSTYQSGQTLGGKMLPRTTMQGPQGQYRPPQSGGIFQPGGGGYGGYLLNNPNSRMIHPALQAQSQQAGIGINNLPQGFQQGGGGYNREAGIGMNNLPQGFQQGGGGYNRQAGIGMNNLPQGFNPMGAGQPQNPWGGGDISQVLRNTLPGLGQGGK